MKKYIIGIDEVGRGPVAGPVAVGVVAYEISSENFLREKMPEARDSKKMTEKKREKIVEIISVLKKEKKVFAKVSFVSAKDIDKIGVVPSIQKAMNSGMKNILNEIEVEKDFSNIILKLDGGLKYDEKIKNQETIIKGDDKEFSIALASIVAKVLRDNKMVELAKKYPDYFLEKHKGYGTKLHMEIIKKKGLSEIHRKTFLGKFLQ
ncbi:MAG TPA: ribonuclease HII [Bacteroidia bacterium]|nr:ribonuclease HII [Bacteroidia bacterium]